MKYAKRVLQSGGALDLSSPRAPIRKNSKALNLARIVLKLAAVNAYNEHDQLKHDDGTYMSDTDIADLLSYATTPTRSRKGVEQFVNRLHEAGVAPIMIPNSQVKQMLAQRTMRVNIQPPATAYDEPRINRLPPDDRVPLNLKRRRSNDDDETPKRQRTEENLKRMADAMKPEPKIDWDDDPDL